MAEWGRKEYSKPWPSRTPVWTVAAERLYLSDYLKSGARGKASATASSRYSLLEAVVGKHQRLVLDDEIERVPDVDGRPGYRLTDEGVKDGVARLEWVTGVFNDRGLHRVMSEAVYADHESWEFYARAVYVSLAFFVLALFVAIPKDRARRMIWKHGRRLRGPELVTTAEFNTKLGRSKGLRVHLPDGIAFVNEEASWYDKLFNKQLSYLKHGNLVVQMRFPYMQIEGRAEKFVERRMTTVATVEMAVRPTPVKVEEHEPIMQPAPARKPPQTVQQKQEQQQPAAVNKQHPYFE